MSSIDPKVLADSQETLSDKSSEDKVPSNPSSPQQNKSPSSPTSSEKSSSNIDQSAQPPAANTRSRNPGKCDLDEAETAIELSVPKKPKLTLVKCGMCPRNVPADLLSDETAFKKECSLCTIEYFNHQKCATNNFYSIVFNKSYDVTLKTTPENDPKKKTKSDLISLSQWNCCKIPYNCSKCKQLECFKCDLKHSITASMSKVECKDCHKKWTVMAKKCVNSSSQFPLLCLSCKNDKKDDKKGDEKDDKKDDKDDSKKSTSKSTLI